MRGKEQKPEKEQEEQEQEREEMRRAQELGLELGLEFRNPALLAQALRHRSWVNSEEGGGGPLASNERLEFLGDAVLELVISEYLYRRYPEEPEGELVRKRAAVVCEATLARRARSLGLGEYLKISSGAEQCGVRRHNSLLGDAFEAVVAALYLDQGLEAAREFILRQLVPEVEAVAAGRILDYKTLLQEAVQHRAKQLPEYELLATEGPAHARRFRVAVRVGGEVLGTGQGPSKKKAEQEAARVAWQKLAD